MPREKTTKYTFRYYVGDIMVSMNNVDAKDDNEAVELAIAARFGFDVEIWDDGRFIHGTDGHGKRFQPRS